MKYLKLLVFVVILTVHFSSAFSEQNRPEKIHFEILGAVIGPTKINGNPWDGVSIKSNATASLVHSMLNTGEAASTIINMIVSRAAQGFRAPDVVGLIYPIGPIPPAAKNQQRQLRLATVRSMTRDSYTPVLRARYSYWTIYPATRFRITLYDRDLNDHDSIGTVELTYGDIMKAVRNGKVTYINVTSQSAGNQILYIKISARRSNNAFASPQAEGQ